MANDAELLGGVDLGGTKIGVAIGDSAGCVLAADRLATDPQRSPDALMAEALQRLTALADARGGSVAALGVASPGPLSYAEGRLLEVPNMLAWQGFPIRAWLEARAGVPFDFMNDANAAVLAEVMWGAAQGARSAVFLTMSTGMGAGLWLDGRVYEGPLALAGEIGHVRLTDDGPVGFGKAGSAEGWLSGPGIAQVAAAERAACAQRGEATELAAGELSPERVCGLAAAGDVAATRIIDRCGRELGRLCALLTDVLNPDVFVLGTIGSAWFELWEPRVRAVLDAEAIPRAAAHVALRPSGLTDRGNQTALAIAARLAKGRQPHPA